MLLLLSCYYVSVTANELVSANETTAIPVNNLTNGATINLIIMKNNPIDFKCKLTPNRQGFDLDVYNLQTNSCGVINDVLEKVESFNPTLNDNFQRRSCGTNCDSYVITPKSEGCFILNCTMGTSLSKQQSCYVFVNIQYPPQSE